MRLKYFLIFLFVIPIVFSQTFEFNQPEYVNGETIILDINTKYPLTSELTNINAHVINKYGRELSSPFSVAKLTDSKYIVYMTIPDIFIDEIYTVRIDNVYYVKDGVFEHFVINEEFNMVEADGPVLGVDPAGARVDLSEQDYFYLNLKNTGNEKTNVELKYGIDIFDVLKVSTIDPGKTKESISNFELPNRDYQKLKIKVKQPGENILKILYHEGREEYNIKVYAVGDLPYDEIPEMVPSDAMKFTNIEGSLVKTIINTETKKGIMMVKNNWNDKLTEIKIAPSSDLYGIVKVEPELITSMRPGEQAEIIVSINEDQNMNSDVQGSIILESNEGAKIELPVMLYYKASAEEVVEEEIEETFFEEIKTEEQVTEEEEAKMGTILSVIAIVFVLIIALFILFKVRKAKPIKKRY